MSETKSCGSAERISGRLLSNTVDFVMVSIPSTSAGRFAKPCFLATSSCASLSLKSASRISRSL